MIYLNGLEAVSALGGDRNEAVLAIRNNCSRAFRIIPGYLPGDIAADLGTVTCPLNAPGDTDSRTGRLAAHCINLSRDMITAAIRHYGPDRVGLVLGTSTSAISEVEQEGRILMARGERLSFDSRIYEVATITDFLKKMLGLRGPCYTVATACSSSARALISALELINAGICDAVITGGADSLSAVSVSGFYSLGALSPGHARPFHRERDGISIGEGAGIALAAREKLEPRALKFLGYGATSDAHHISAPDPSGKMPAAAMRKALDMSELDPGDIGYLNLHGTGTRLNDAMEGRAVYEVFGNRVPTSSVKHLAGHTLGAAGITGAYVASLVLDGVPLPRHDYRPEEFREEFPELDLVTASERYAERPYVMVNSFAFGGNNVSMVFGK